MNMINSSSFMKRDLQRNLDAETRFVDVIVKGHSSLMNVRTGGPPGKSAASSECGLKS